MIEVSKGARYPDTWLFLDRNPLDFIEQDIVLLAVVELGCPRWFLVGDLLRHFQFAAAFQIGRDPGRAEG